MLLKICAIAAIIVSVSVGVAAQAKSCDLRLKVFSYDALESPRNRLTNVDVKIKGGETNQKLLLTVDPLDPLKGVIENLNEGTYRLEFRKAGYKKRDKKVELDCDLVGENDPFENYTYLWRDMSVPADNNDLLANDRKSSGKTAATIEEGSKEPKSGPSEEKPLGKVTIKILIDFDGNVISASLVSGEKQLAEKAMRMAMRAKFLPTLLSGTPVQVTGDIVYNFVP